MNHKYDFVNNKYSRDNKILTKNRLVTFYRVSNQKTYLLFMLNHIQVFIKKIPTSLYLHIKTY